MKKFIFLSILTGIMPFTAFAQDDDLYFVPSKTVETAKVTPQNSDNYQSDYYSGSSRDVDEYNRHGKYWSHYQSIGSDSAGNDIIKFTKGNGIYPDSAYIDTTFVGRYYDTIVNDGGDDDYTYSQRMSRWDGYYDPWLYSYRYGYRRPWRYGWYNSWYDPWYYGCGGWYDPWYYDSWYGYGWGYPYDYWGYGDYPYYHGGGFVVRRQSAGSIHPFPNHGNNMAGTQRTTFGNRTGGTRYSSSNDNRTFGSRTYSENRQNNVTYQNRNNNNNFGTRQNSTTYSNSSNSSFSRGANFGSRSSSGGSFGGSFGGGSRSGGGGGHFGGRR
nr:hypothetical protein [Prevotella sp.]